MNFHTPSAQWWEHCPLPVSGWRSHLPSALMQPFLIVHVNPVPSDHSTSVQPASLTRWYLKPTIPSLNIFHNLFLPFPFSRFSHYTHPHFRHLKSNCGLAFKTRVRGGALGGRTSRGEVLVLVWRAFNTSCSRFTLSGQRCFQGFPPCFFFPLKAHFLLLFVFSFF